MEKPLENGIIDFGRFKGKKWSEVKKSYLEYLITDECLTSLENKAIARCELRAREVCPGQEEMFAEPSCPLCPDKDCDCEQENLRDLGFNMGG